MDKRNCGFTFICVTYNHEKYVEEHLNSIIELIQRFGKDRILDLIVADDGSRDLTTNIVDRWLDINRSYFRSVKCLYSNENVGLVSNLHKAINAVDTKDFKFLAGDDKYNDQSDIFELIDSLGVNEIVATPLIPFGGEGADYNEIVFRFRTLIYCAKNKKIPQLLKYDNFLHAPGVFYKGELMRDDQLWRFLSPYRNIEDYPMWYYFVFLKHFCVRVLPVPYVYYRMSSGISTQKDHNQRKGYDSEIIRLRKNLKIRRYKYHKYVNIYRYLGCINRFLINICKREINMLIGNSDEMTLYKR